VAIVDLQLETRTEVAEIVRRDAELRQREAELAEREAAMARFAPMEPARAVAARPQTEPNGYTVLVVDDEEQVRALTVRILTRFGYQVLEAPGVEQAMAALDDSNSGVDLVLSDVAMPGLSGKDLFRKISESRPGLPVVFMSGYALGVYAPEGLMEEGVKLLPKPFNQEALLEFVTEALPGEGVR
jgi:CheY-like chemotaxis protein